ncbi:MAG: class I SAM-dependent methyltransferase [Proteobacteria bacterium]|nr:class I SAM-dependent methyltransferase [Pseudomonadota bacterium]
MKTIPASRWPLPPLRWPLPALLAWALAWAGFAAARACALPPGPSALLASALGAALAFGVQGGWRRLIVAAGFPLSSLALGTAAPAWAWLLAALPLVLAYPLRAWSDAPLFPTPRHALRPLAAAIALPAGARVLDAGCGLGHGLRALHAAWPAARIEGVEWSALLAWACARRCRFAAVRRGDLWAGDWRGLQLVYLFQRPESMARAWAKAEAELPRGAWLVSLEFAVPGVQPWRRLDAGGGRPLWLYRMDSKKCSDGR